MHTRKVPMLYFNVGMFISAHLGSRLSSNLCRYLHNIHIYNLYMTAVIHLIYGGQFDLIVGSSTTYTRDCEFDHRTVQRFVCIKNKYLRAKHEFAKLNTCSIASIVAMDIIKKNRFVHPLESLVSIQNFGPLGTLNDIHMIK
jgi:hypothetical protein